MKTYIKTLSALLVAFFMIMLVVNPARYMGSISEGLTLFAISVLPSMFPFFFFSRILTSLDVAKNIAVITKKPSKFLFNAPDIGGYILAMSMLSGYPVGAKLVADSYEKGLCDADGARSLIAFTSTSGPLFVLGTIGTGMLGSYTAGIIILAAHYIGAFLNGIVFKNRKKTSDSPGKLPLANYDNVLSDAITSSISSVLIVGGFIAIFNMIISVCGDIGIFNYFGKLFENVGVPSMLTEGVMSGIIEVTRGSLILSSTPYSMSVRIPLITFLVSFGSMSVTLQSLTFLSKCGIKASYYLLTKLSQGVLSAVAAALLCLLL